MMTVSKFLDTLKKMASVKTLYVMGGWGFPLTASNKKRAYTQPYNCSAERKKKIEAASADTFGFDCCGIVKSALWGWIGDPNQTNGGAKYASNGVPDYDAKEFMFSGCKDPSQNMSKIDAGEFLWFNGHCGVYLGNGKTIESTPSWKDGVQIRDFDSRWKYHGHLRYVDYSGVQPQPQPTPSGYTPGHIYKVTCKGPLRIRTSAETGSDLNIIDNLYRGNKVECRETLKDSKGRIWIRIDGWTCAEESGVKYIE